MALITFPPKTKEERHSHGRRVLSSRMSGDSPTHDDNDDEERHLATAYHYQDRQWTRHQLGLTVDLSRAFFVDDLHQLFWVPAIADGFHCLSMDDFSLQLKTPLGADSYFLTILENQNLPLPNLIYLTHNGLEFWRLEPQQREIQPGSVQFSVDGVESF